MGDRNDDLKKALEEALSEIDGKADAKKVAEEKRTEEMKAVKKRLEKELEGEVSENEMPEVMSESEEPEILTEPEEPEAEAESVSEETEEVAEEVKAEEEEPKPDLEEIEAETEEPESEPIEAEAEEPEENEAEAQDPEEATEGAEEQELGEVKAGEEEPEPESKEVEAEKEEMYADVETLEAETDSEYAKAEPEASEADRKKKKSNLIYNLIIVIGVCMVIGGGIAIFQKYKNDADTKEMYSDLENEFVTVNNEDETETEIDWGFDWVSADGSSSYTSTVWYEQISVDFDGLNNINEDVVGWIYQENGEVSYPLMYSGDNEQYLRHTLYNVESTSGSIFISGESAPDMSDSLTMIYGHNMKNGSMFGSLKQYKEDDTYYENHQYFQIYTEDGMAYRYQVYAYFDIDDQETAMEDLLFYDSEDETSAIMTEMVIQEEDETQTEITTEVILNEENTYEAYLETIAARTVLDTDIEVTTDDQIIGLWTCTASGTKRFLVFAVKVDEHNFNEEEETQAQDLNALDR